MQVLIADAGGIVAALELFKTPASDNYKDAIATLLKYISKEKSLQV